MTDPHPLDRPVWNALHSGWAALAQGNGRAVRLEPAFGPFAAAQDASPEAQAALAALAPDDGQLWIVETGPVAPPPGMAIVRTAALAQMVAEAPRPRAAALPALDLGDADAAEMRALAELTQPGPFAERTHRLGGFVGLRENGRLIAMAGERMRLPGLCEVSGVCTHPDRRGRGLAGALMSIVIARMTARGETPFLHSYASNAGAIALYESLGFKRRREMVVTVVERTRLPT
jgi:predicted GNAT family acetyltransferase